MRVHWRVATAGRLARRRVSGQHRVSFLQCNLVIRPDRSLDHDSGVDTGLALMVAGEPAHHFRIGLRRVRIKCDHLAARIAIRPGLAPGRIGKHYRDLRARVLRRDGWRCQMCGAASNLTVHHQQYRSHSGEDTEQNLITLCTGCHSAEHLGLKLMLVENFH